MCKKNKKTALENLVLKKGTKHTTEKLMKKLFKFSHKTSKKTRFIESLKLAIVQHSKFSTEAQQTIKLGKRKRVLKTTMLLVSERVRYLNSWKNVLKTNTTKVKTPFPERIYSQVTGKGVIIDQNPLFNVAEKKGELHDDTTQAKRFLKYRW